VGSLARAAVAWGVDALFLEIHPDPAQALSDRDTQLPLEAAGALLSSCLAVHAAVAGDGGAQPNRTSLWAPVGGQT
jgi:2-dehydro-3-deoxyphosphooctonate aldolase (KDO 8-P synthase)